MSKIICDICGTSYPETAECCPICGCSRDAAAELLGEEFLTEEITAEPKAKAGRFSSNKKKKEIFDFDEVNTELEETFEEENPYEEDDEYEEQPKHNTLLVILLTVLIVALLGAAAFFYFRFFRPNNTEVETAPPTTVQVTTQETTRETTEPVIPCQSLVLTSGSANLTKEGQFFLLHVIAMPEDTTDVMRYASADESIATVSEDGKITAVSEGETVVYITCGNIQLTCPVVVKYEEETVPTTEATEATEETVKPNVTLKLKQTDIRLGVYYEYQLILDCDLDPTEVEWSSEHPHIATVDENGVVKAIKDGTTAIIVKYGDQQVQCIVRCSY